MLRGDGVWRGKPGETAAFHCVLGIRSKAFLKAKVGLSPLPGPPQWLVVYRAFVSGAKVSIVDLTCS
jgi:hypothetical protein